MSFYPTVHSVTLTFANFFLHCKIHKAQHMIGSLPIVLILYDCRSNENRMSRTTGLDYCLFVTFTALWNFLDFNNNKWGDGKDLSGIMEWWIGMHSISTGQLNSSTCHDIPLLWYSRGRYFTCWCFGVFINLKMFPANKSDKRGWGTSAGSKKPQQLQQQVDMFEVSFTLRLSYCIDMMFILI